jgi:hypothetical protein
MEVETTAGDLGEQDISTARVQEVLYNQQGEVESIVVKKGALFQKTLEVPVSRIEAIELLTEVSKEADGLSPRARLAGEAQAKPETTPGTVILATTGTR